MVSETTVAESERTVSDADATDRDGDGQPRQGETFTGWFASSSLRLGLVLLGVFLLLMALGQLSGIDVIGRTAALLGTEVGRWLLVAVVAIGLIAVAVRGFGRSA